MTKAKKRNLKIFIAGSLAVALIAGAYQGYGQIDTSAQEKTLPGIEKMVAEYLESGNTMNVLEVVMSDPADASFGYLVGGEEPVSEGRELSELPSAFERRKRMSEVETSIGGSRLLDAMNPNGEDGLFSFVTYDEPEDDTGTRSEVVRGKFVLNEDGHGNYNYTYEEPVYRMLGNGEVTTVQRYDRNVSFAQETAEEDTVSGNAVQTVKQGTVITFSNVNDERPVTVLGTGEGDETGFAADRYYIKGEQLELHDVSSEAPELNNYAGRDVYIVKNEQYLYYGKVVYAEDVPEEYFRVSGWDVSSGDADGIPGDNQETVSGNATDVPEDDGITTSPAADKVGLLYILNYQTKSAFEWITTYKYGEEDLYEVNELPYAYFVDFVKDSNGNLYISQADYCEDGPWILTSEYVPSLNGRYIMEKEGVSTVVWRGEADFNPALGTYDFIRDDTGEPVDTILYDGGFFSNEFFKRYVLNLSGKSRYEKDGPIGTEMDDLKIEVHTVTVQELAEMMDETYTGVKLDDMALIYLSGQGNAVPEPESIGDAAMKILKLAFGVGDNGETDVLNRVPVIVDYNFYAKNGEAGNMKLEMLSLSLLMAKSDAFVKEVAAADENFWNDYSPAELLYQVEQQLTSELTDLGIENISLAGLKEYLSANVYLNNDTEVPYVAADYLTDFGDESMTGQHHKVVFADVLTEIEYENFLLSTARKEGEVELISTAVNKASITRYILNWSMRRTTVKDSLRVLDLEPCYDFEEETALNAEDIKRYMNMPEYDGTINIVQMPSEEFIGKIEDLNETYDLIYVGARTGTMNTEDGITVYNDDKMNGLIYTHVGDQFSYDAENDNNKSRLIDDSLIEAKRDIEEAYYYRGPGNDMNSTREEEFEQFIEAGYPVVFADELLSNIDGEVEVNAGRVDCNSYFYDLIEFALSKDNQGNYRFWQKSVYAESQLELVAGETAEATEARQARQTMLCNYLNLSKLEIDWVTNLGEMWMPTEYEYSDDEDEIEYLQPSGGKYSMQFIFTLSNNASVSQLSSTYDCGLYVDNNADGRFTGSDYSANRTGEATEELGGISMYRYTGSGWESVERTLDGNFELYTGMTYKVVRQLPDDYQGMLPWKLVFYDNSDRLIRTSKSGYTAINKGTKETIRVLQLLSDRAASGGRTNWNMSNDAVLRDLLLEVPEFDIQLTSIQVSQFLDNLGIPDAEVNDGWDDNTYWNEDFYQKYYNAAYSEIFTYDMVILGFSDNYGFGADYTYKRDNQNDKVNYIASTAGADVIRDYIEEGKSVLFTHDSSSYVNSLTTSNQGWHWGYEFNKTLRAAVGLDRYGALIEYYDDMANDENLSDDVRRRYADYLDKLEDRTLYQYDTLLQPGDEDGTPLVHKEGLTKYTTIRYMINHFNAIRNSNGDYGKIAGYNAYMPINNQLFYEALDKSQGDQAFGRMYYGFGAPNTPGPDYIATMVNEGQITNYPFKISDDELKTLTVSNTHYQWLQPNMELDKDGDGKNDIVVWYCLSDLSEDGKARKYANDGSYTNYYNVCPNDVVNNYYIYSMGNVTYSGVGHTAPTGEAEKKLFVNTMVAAYNSSVKAPSVSFVQDGGEELETLYMLYDAQNGILINGQGTLEANFKSEDFNILSEVPKIRIEFFKACEAGTDGALEIAGIPGVVLPVSPGNVTITEAGAFDVTPTLITDENSFDGYFVEGAYYYELKAAVSYRMNLNISELGLFTQNGTTTVQLNDAATTDTIYVRATTIYDGGTKRTESGVDRLNISAAQMFELN